MTPRLEHSFLTHAVLQGPRDPVAARLSTIEFPATQFEQRFLDMLDCFEIITTSGVVLWSRSNAPVGAGVVNSLINDVFIEEKVPPAPLTADGISRKPAYKYEKYTLKWVLNKELGLIFVVRFCEDMPSVRQTYANRPVQAVYQSLLRLTWVDKLLDNIATIFVNVYREDLAKSDASIRPYDFDAYFDQQIKELGDVSTDSVSEEQAEAELQVKTTSPEDGNLGGPPPPLLPGLLRAQSSKTAALNGDSNKSTPVQSPDTSRPTTPIPGHLLTAKNASPGGRGSRRARKAANTSTSAASSADESRRPKVATTASKKMRKWDDDGNLVDDDGTNLDYSATSGVENSGDEDVRPPPTELISALDVGNKTKSGQFVLKDLDDEVSDILKSQETSNLNGSSTGVVGSGFGAISGYFRSIVGGKTITKQDLQKPLKAMEDHLIEKNVAREAAVRLCEGVEKEMLGKKTGTFESIDKALQPALETSLRKILTSSTDLDLLREIEAVTSPGAKAKARPYVISVVGVNGVGKSTNLSKICYFLLQNNYRVLIAACDTFRSGAVEQLNVHVRNLKELAERDGVGQVDLYQKGYGKDAANVAKDAVDYATENSYNVVLIDTAGRRHNDTRLMSSLEKFARFANPDKILMVGEALVGNDSVMQARNFNAAFGSSRGLDGFIISKCDTVGDMIGTLVSLVHATGIPVVFLGVGQHYGDLRSLSVPWAVKLLMQ